MSARSWQQRIADIEDALVTGSTSALPWPVILSDAKNLPSQTKALHFEISRRKSRKNRGPKEILRFAQNDRVMVAEVVTGAAPLIPPLQALLREAGA